MAGSTKNKVHFKYGFSKKLGLGLSLAIYSSIVLSVIPNRLLPTMLTLGGIFPKFLPVHGGGFATLVHNWPFRMFCNYLPLNQYVFKLDLVFE